jgi:hypothetical protein
MGCNYFIPASIQLPSAHEQEREYKNISSGEIDF